MLDDTFELAKALARNNPSWVYISPFDDPLIWYAEPRATPPPLGTYHKAHHHVRQLYPRVHGIV